MYNPKTQSLYYYWMGLRQTRRVPARQDIEPKQIKTLLPNLFMLEQLDTRHVVFRLAGTALCHRYGREFRAHNFLSLWRGSDQIEMMELIDDVLMTATPGLVTYRGESIDQKSLDSEILLLPLSDEAGKIDRLLGIAQPLDNTNTLQHRKIVKQWIVDSELIAAPSLSTHGNNGAPRPARVDKADLRLVVANADT